MPHPKVTVTINKAFDKEILLHFIDERDDDYDFGYERIIKDHPALARCRGKREAERKAVIDPYVDAYYAHHAAAITRSKERMQALWDTVAPRYFAALEDVFGALTFYPEEHIAALLSIAKCGVIGDDRKDFQIWYGTVKEPSEVRRHFAHEILHFYYYAYAAHKGYDRLLEDWDLAEIFNVVMLGLPAFVRIIGKADAGYAQHERYFPYYKKLWRTCGTLDAYLQETNAAGLVTLA